MSGCYCKSLYPFSGEQHLQGLTLEVGDRVRVVQAPPGGWWEGEKDGATGWFPSSYVQVLEVRAASRSFREKLLSLLQEKLLSLLQEELLSLLQGEASLAPSGRSFSRSAPHRNGFSRSGTGDGGEDGSLRPRAGSLADWLGVRSKMAERDANVPRRQKGFGGPGGAGVLGAACRLTLSSTRRRSTDMGRVSKRSHRVEACWGKPDPQIPTD
ncbi:hypothetical protein NHX12_024485 [Muraenolepis orangiensis]|uniref:SH3 domain-containing protein n=1 Tax=Muraenolepis orangiensis TaxID=630683 RepID=A0A9Q0IQR6_9TELE|nr:hypothetical protein NHX12_024485 [Muraenolepis orangiensis]